MHIFTKWNYQRATSQPHGWDVSSSGCTCPIFKKQSYKQALAGLIKHELVQADENSPQYIHLLSFQWEPQTNWGTIESLTVLFLFFLLLKGHKNLEYILQQPLKVNLMNPPTSLWEMENNVHNTYEWKIDTECVCEWQNLEKEQSLLGRCGHLLIVACMETNDWGNLCAPHSARNRGRGHGTHSWLGCRHAVLSWGYMRDKAINTASVEMSSLSEFGDKLLVFKSVICAPVSRGYFCLNYYHNVLTLNSQLNWLHSCMWTLTHFLSTHAYFVCSHQTVCIFQCLYFETFVRLSQAWCYGPDWKSLECGHMGHNLFQFTAGTHTSIPKCYL